jgi:hypothetical protein
MKEMTDQQFIEMVKQPVLIRPIDEIYDELLSSIKKILT